MMVLSKKQAQALLKVLAASYGAISAEDDLFGVEDSKNCRAVRRWIRLLNRRLKEAK